MQWNIASSVERGEEVLPRISFWMVARSSTIAELPALVQKASDMGVDEAYLQRLVITGHGSATAAESLHGRLEPQHLEAIARAEELAAARGVALRASGRKPPVESLTPDGDAEPWRGCWRPWRSAVVTASQRVLPCCIASFIASYDRLTLGELRDGRDWAEIWNGPAYRALRRGLLSGDPIDYCRRCGLDWSL